eukprot:9514416-Alexandrium_andersonii.AAC.1
MFAQPLCAHAMSITHELGMRMPPARVCAQCLRRTVARNNRRGMVVLRWCSIGFADARHHRRNAIMLTCSARAAHVYAHAHMDSTGMAHTHNH